MSNLYLEKIPLGSGDLELLNWAHATRFPDNRTHRHTFFEICLVGAYGEGAFIVRGNRHTVRPGQLFIARPGIDHQIVNTGSIPMELYWVCFQWNLPNPAQQPSLVDNLLVNLSESEVLVADDPSGEVTMLWKTIQSIMDGPETLGWESQLAGLSTALVIGIAQRASPAALSSAQSDLRDTADNVARLAIRFIQDNLHHELSVADVASQVHLSPRHLTRIISQYTGLAPAKYITSVRLERAKTLLQTTSIPIKEIAVEVGYPDVHHFTRAYSVHFKVSPGGSRKRHEDNLS